MILFHDFANFRDVQGHARLHPRHSHAEKILFFAIIIFFLEDNLNNLNNFFSLVIEF